MAVTDPIADMLTRIRNAQSALHKDLNMWSSKVKEALAGILKEEGYIRDFSVDGHNLKIILKYDRGRPLIAGLKRISKPGRRVYVPAAEIPEVQNGLGVAILSTSKGIMVGKEAKAANVGGELLCEIW